MGLFGNALKTANVSIYGNVISGKYDFCALCLGSDSGKAFELNPKYNTLRFYTTSDTVKRYGQPALKDLKEEVNVKEIASYDIKDVYDAYETTIEWKSGEKTVIRTEKNQLVLIHQILLIHLGEH